MKRKLFSVVIALFLAVSLFAAGICIYGTHTVCRQELLLEQLESTGYTRELYGEIVARWQNLLTLAGVAEPETILCVLTPETVAEDAAAYFRNACNGAATPDNQDLRTALEQALRSYAEAHNIQARPQTELEEHNRTLVNACMADYRLIMQNPLLPKAVNAVLARRDLLKTGGYIAGAASALFLAALFFLQEKRRNTLYYAAISAASCAVSVFGVWGYFHHKNILQTVAQSPIKTLAAGYLTRLLQSLRLLGDIYLAAAAALLLGYLTCCFLKHRKSL